MNEFDYEYAKRLTEDMIQKVAAIDEETRDAQFGDSRATSE